MPQATKESVTRVKVDLISSKVNYEPGDTLSGFIVWSSPHIGFVRVRLFGHVKTKIERKQATRGRAILFDRTKILYNGTPCKQGEQARSFAIVIPTTIRKYVKAYSNEAIWGGNKLGVKDEWLESSDFLSTADNTGDFPLPFSYYFNAAGMGVKTEALIQYVLQAETAVSEQASKNEANLGLTSLSLVIRMPRVAEITTRDLLTRGLPGNITAYSKDDGFDKSTVTFRHKMKKAFRSSSLPRFGFDIVVSTPTHIQLDDQRPFPFRVSLFPNLLRAQTNVCTDGDVSKLPIIRVTSLKLKLRSFTLVRCPASWMDDESDRFHEYKWNFIDPFNYAIPVGGFKNLNKAHDLDISTSKFTTATPSSPVDFLDLGDILKLRLTPLRTDAQGAMSEQLPRPIWPTFKTFSINVSYELLYELKVECLGEKETVTNNMQLKSSVTILPPAHDKHTEMKTRQGEIDVAGLTTAAGGVANQILSVFVPGWPF